MNEQLEMDWRGNHERARSLLLTALTLTAAVAAENWLAWRGPDGQGRSAKKNLPLKWSVTDNVKWKVPLPAAGNSIPVKDKQGNVSQIELKFSVGNSEAGIRMVQRSNRN